MPLRRGWRVPCPRRVASKHWTKTTNWLDLGHLLFQLGWQRWIWNICVSFQVCLQNNMDQLGANHGRSGYIRHSRDDRYGKGKGRKIIKRWIWDGLNQPSKSPIFFRANQAFDSSPKWYLQYPLCRGKLSVYDVTQAWRHFDQCQKFRCRNICEKSKTAKSWHPTLEPSKNTPIPSDYTGWLIVFPTIY